MTKTSNAPDTPNAVDTTPFVLTRTVNAPRDLVWRAFTERESLAQWLSPTGMTVLPEGRLELRPGGLYHYGLRAAEKARQHHRQDREEACDACLRGAASGLQHKPGDCDRGKDVANK